MAKILLLEPDHILAKNTQAGLKHAGHKVIWAPDAQSAISRVDELTPDLIISDLLLAGRSGIEFLYELRSYPEWQAVPVILLSSLPQTEVDLHGSGFLQLNIAKYFYKPHTSLAQLVQAARELTAVPSKT